MNMTDPAVQANTPAGDNTGASVASPPSPPIGASTSGAEQEIDAFAPAKADDFTLPPGLFPEGVPPPHMVEQSAQFRGWLEEARLPKSIGDFLADEVAKVGNAFSAMGEAEQVLYQRSERAHLERLWGPEETQRKIELARQLVLEIDERRPGLVDLLLDTGAGNSAMVIMNLALHAERLAARRD